MITRITIWLVLAVMLSPPTIGQQDPRFSAYQKDIDSIFLISSDLTLEPLEIVQLYGYRFKIAAGFRQAVHALASYGYHFWMMAMKPLHRGDGDQHLHHASDAYRDGVRRKVLAYHRYLRWWARGLPMVPGLSRWRPR